jgi:hypothetical protein
MPAPVRESAFGTKQTSNRRPAMSAFGGKADISALPAPSAPARPAENVRFRGQSGHREDAPQCPLMTQSGHRKHSGLAQFAFFTGGGDHVPSRIEGGVSFGQYILIIRMN